MDGQVHVERLAMAPPDNQWVREHYGRLRHSAWLLCGDAHVADDLTQETFARAIDGWDRFEGRCEVSTWLYSILLRLHAKRCRSLIRAAARVQRWLEIKRRSDPIEEDPAAKLASQAWRESLWSEVAKLPPRQQQVVMLRFAEGFTYQQIADSCGCPLGTAKTRLHSALLRLRDRHQIQVIQQSITDESMVPMEVEVSEHLTCDTQN